MQLLCSRNGGAGGCQWAPAISTCVLLGYALHVHTKCSFPPAPGRATATRGHLKDTRSVGSRCLGRGRASPASLSRCAKLWHAAKPHLCAFLILSFCSCPWVSELVVCRKQVVILSMDGLLQVGSSWGGAVLLNRSLNNCTSRDCILQSSRACRYWT